MNDIESIDVTWQEILASNLRLSANQAGLDEVQDRLVEGMLMEAILPAGSMKRFVHRVGELPAHLLEEISLARMDERHNHLNELLD